MELRPIESAACPGDADHRALLHVFNQRKGDIVGMGEVAATMRDENTIALALEWVAGVTDRSVTVPKPRKFVFGASFIFSALFHWSPARRAVIPAASARRPPESDPDA